MAGHGDVQAQTSLVFHLHSALGICKVGVAIAAVVVLDDALFQAGSLKAFAGRSDVVCSQLALGLTAALTSSCLGAGGFAECVAQSCNVVVSIAAIAAFDSANMQGKAVFSAAGSNHHSTVIFNSMTADRLTGLRGVVSCHDSICQRQNQNQAHHNTENLVEIFHNLPPNFLSAYAEV